MNKFRSWILGAALATLSLVAMAPQSVRAAGGPAQWCPGIYTAVESAGCIDFETIQEALNRAKLDRKPGNIYLWGPHTFSEPVITVGGLKMVRIIGGIGSGETNIDGTLTISKSSAISVEWVTVTGNGGVTVTGHKGPLKVSNVIGGISVLNSKLTSGTFTDSTGQYSFEKGLHMNAIEGPITLTGVTATKSIGMGADISTFGNYPVTISRSHFDKNGDRGLNLGAGGEITLTDITASGNGMDGALIESGGALSITTKKSTVNRFDSNGGDFGLVAIANGEMVVNDISANGNTGDGAVLTSITDLVKISTNRGKHNTFDKNGSGGLHVYAIGVVTAQDLSASGNTSYGAYLASGGAGVQVAALAGKQNFFDKNGDRGLHVEADGSITLTDVTASGNSLDGAFIKSGGALSITTEKSKVNRFDLNGTDGLTAIGNGEMLLHDISASKNIGNGATFTNSADTMQTIMMTNRAKRNIFDKNGGYGLNAQAIGLVSAVDLSANGNASYGARFYSDGDEISIGTWAGRLNSFDKNGSDGLIVLPGQQAYIYDISASGNKGMGLNINSSAPVTLATARAKQNTITGNKGIGAKIVTFNTVKVLNTLVGKNGDAASSGLWLDSNDHAMQLACIKVTGNPGTGMTLNAGTLEASFASVIFSGNGTPYTNNGTSAPVSTTVKCPVAVP